MEGTISSINASSYTAVLTGGTGRLGREILSGLVEEGVREVIMLGRRYDALMKVGLEQAAATPGLKFGVIPCDFGDLEQVGEACNAVSDALHQPTVVVMSANTRLPDRFQAGAEGLELGWTVNVLARHLMLRELLPELAELQEPGVRSRVVLTGSFHADAPLTPAPILDDYRLFACSVDPDGQTWDERVEEAALAWTSAALANVYLVGRAHQEEGDVDVSVFDPGREGHPLRIQDIGRQCARFALYPYERSEAAAYLAAARFPRPSDLVLDQDTIEGLWEACTALEAGEPPIAHE